MQRHVASAEFDSRRRRAYIGGDGALLTEEAVGEGEGT